jgi:hypothetical protein
MLLPIAAENRIFSDHALLVYLLFCDLLKTS